VAPWLLAQASAAGAEYFATYSRTIAQEKKWWDGFSLAAALWLNAMSRARAVIDLAGILTPRFRNLRQLGLLALVPLDLIKAAVDPTPARLAQLARSGSHRGHRSPKFGRYRHAVAAEVREDAHHLLRSKASG
jgi:hypothetical protein